MVGFRVKGEFTKPVVFLYMQASRARTFGVYTYIYVYMYVCMYIIVYMYIFIYLFIYVFIYASIDVLGLVYTSRP